MIVWYNVEIILKIMIEGIFNFICLSPYHRAKGCSIFILRLRESIKLHKFKLLLHISINSFIVYWLIKLLKLWFFSLVHMKRRTSTLLPILQNSWYFRRCTIINRCRHWRIFFSIFGLLLCGSSTKRLILDPSKLAPLVFKIIICKNSIHHLLFRSLKKISGCFIRSCLVIFIIYIHKIYLINA